MTQPEYIQKTFEVFPRSYIMSNNEIIISEKGNVYFRLEDVENKNDYIKKILHWCSRSACKAMPYSSPRYNRLFRQTIREGLNAISGFDLSSVPTWTSGVTYAIGAVVKNPNDGKYYRNKDANSHSAWHSEYFDEISDLANTSAISDIKTYSSSDEVLIGTWNGVNLYRKVFTGTATTTDETVNIPITATKARIMNFYCRGDNGAFGSDYYTSSSDRARCWFESDRLRFSFGSSYPSLPVQWCVVLEYIH